MLQKHYDRTRTFLLILCLFLAGCAKSQTTVSGEIFIVTQGADNIKLGSINVVAIPAEILEDGVFERRWKIKAKMDAHEERLKKCLQAQLLPNDCDEKDLGNDLPGLIVGAIPENAISAVINADGKFSFKLPQNEKYALFAKGQRKVGNKEEKYFWLEIIEPKTEDLNIILSNNNLYTIEKLKTLLQ